MPDSTASSKYFLRELSLIRLYTVLIISFVYFVVQMVVGNMAHSLILQLDAYHMLYNVLGLITSIITTKMCREGSNLKNTFGWTRIDVCGAVANFCFLSALCFSMTIESLQTMLHASHHEKMSMPLVVLIVGLSGVLVNALSYIIIGGYTRQQKSFLGSHRDGQDIHVISPASRRGPTNPKLERGGPMDVSRDFLGCLLVILVAVLAIFVKGNELVDFADPCLTILAILFLGVLSYQQAKEAGYILLLTIPGNMNVESMLEELFQSFPEISDIHEFHLWQLNPSRIIATAHVVLKSTENCWIVQNNIVEFLEARGITKVTLQPEFLELQGNNGESEGPDGSPESLKRRQCFLPCKPTDDCHEKKCCLSDEDVPTHSRSPSLHHHGHGHAHGGNSEGHSHGGGGAVGWSFQNPLKSKSMGEMNKKGKEDGLKPPNMSSHRNVSYPELAKDKDAIAVGSMGARANSQNIPPQPEEQSASVERSNDEDNSDDDEEDAVRKPMI